LHRAKVQDARSAQHFTLTSAAVGRGGDLPLEKRERIGILLLTIHDLDRRMSWLDLYLVALFLALVGLLVAKFRG